MDPDSSRASKQVVPAVKKGGVLRHSPSDPLHCQFHSPEKLISVKKKKKGHAWTCSTPPLKPNIQSQALQRALSPASVQWTKLLCAQLDLARVQATEQTAPLTTAVLFSWKQGKKQEKRMHLAIKQSYVSTTGRVQYVQNNNSTTVSVSQTGVYCCGAATTGIGSHN